MRFKRWPRPESYCDTSRILVVEDEYLIRADIAAYLRDCGFVVIEAGTAADAVGMLESDLVVELVFSDIQMPGVMDGVRLAAWVRERLPGVRVILTSGFVHASEVASGLCDEGPIPKPYDHRRLADRIRHHLAAAGIAPDAG